MLSATVFSASLVLLIAFGLVQKSRPILALKPLSDLLFSSSWHPFDGEFGLAAFIMGTIWVTAVAMIIAIPISLLTSIYLAEYAPGRVRGVIKPLIDLLAGIPSVVFGLFGLLLIVPFTRSLAAAFGSTTVATTCSAAASYWS